jgi:hypothetical protein
MVDLLGYDPDAVFQNGLIDHWQFRKKPVGFVAPGAFFEAAPNDSPRGRS